ncbi:MAG: glycosyltransferase [Bryobacteraceae bacterium]|nr:glycosyltransferase [Bryobacteraceae bacterium]
MRLAFFCPLPPRKSGIADYAAALLEGLKARADVQTFDETAAGFEPERFDCVLYQIGNNPYHAVAYETALEHPGVVVLHESNLHHLLTDITIRRGDWDAYMREVEYDGGPAAAAYARRVRALEVGPDYEGVPVLRRILERSRAVIVHSRFMEERVRAAGFNGPVAVIPHGAWIPEADRMGYRQRLGLDETAPLTGIFGYLKPYKRIAQSLRAFRRLLRLEPRAKMILVGEAHPELPLAAMIDALDLGAAVRRPGFTSIDDFVGYLAACDIVLNLRYPTVGESSGTLLRALGLGKATVVSDVGAFRELPDEICLKAPVDETEEDVLFEYLDLLASRPDARRTLGENASAWVQRECRWDRVAELYATFLEAVVNGTEWRPPDPSPKAVEPARPAEPVAADYLATWAGNADGAAGYMNIHLTRFEKTLGITPPGGPEDRILEMGAYLQITPSLKTKLGYGEVRGCYYGPAGKVDHRTVTSDEGETFECYVDLFDAERDLFPYADEHFAAVLCCELLEHLAEDPMHMMSEVNRILKPGGHLVLTTPNISSLRAIAAILTGYHPGFFPAYIRPKREGEETDARHNREYTPREIARLLIDAGFEVTSLDTGPYREEPKPEHLWVVNLLERYQLSRDLRGDAVYAVGRKTGPVRSRYPDWLYDG